MRISTKGRYALASMITLAQYWQTGDCVTVVSISDKLGISKIYLEQVFALLKRGGLVHSIKGAQGGYQLSRTPADTNVYDILAAVEVSLFERTEDTVLQQSPSIESALRSAVFDPIDYTLKQLLSELTLQLLIEEAESKQSPDHFMFFI